MAKEVSLELRAYRYISVILLSTMTAVAGYVASAAIKVTERLPGIEMQLVTLNRSLENLETIPIEVRVQGNRLEQVERRIANLESNRRGG